MDTLKPRVCIIGAGLCGLVALRHYQDIADIVCYEIKDVPGGMWNYSDLTDETVDQSIDMFANMYGHNHASMYENLIADVPKPLMRLKDFPDSIDHTYYTVPEFKQYLLDYMKHFDLEKHINYSTAVVSVKRSDGPKHWEIVIKSDAGTSTEYFDYVLVANGHNSVPYFSTQGVTNIDKFSKLIIHAHNFRSPYDERFKDKNILIIGSKVSGGDILVKLCGAGETDKAAPEIKSIVINQGDFGFLENSTNLKPFYDSGLATVTKSSLTFIEDSVIFDDGTERPIDVVIFCTGYMFSYPFLKEEGLLEVDTENRFLYPLYKRFFCANDPTLMFAGVNDGPTAFTLMEKNIILGKYFIKGSLSLPSEDDMKKDIEEYKSKFETLRACYQPPANLDLEEFEKLHKFLSDNSSEEVPPMNTEHFDALKKILWKMWMPLSKGDLIDFKKIDITGLDIMDSAEFF